MKATGEGTGFFVVVCCVVIILGATTAASHATTTLRKTWLVEAVVGRGWPQGCKAADGHTYRVTIGTEWSHKGPRPQKEVGTEDGHHITMSSEQINLGIAAMAHSCQAARFSGKKETDGWCQLIKKPNINYKFVRCPEKENNRQATIGQIIERAQAANVEERNIVTFKELNAEDQSYRCKFSSNKETKGATSEMPEERSEINSLQCSLLDPSNKETINPQVNRSKCFYNMTWLNYAVGYYSCDIKRSEECTEVIKDAFENVSYYLPQFNAKIKPSTTIEQKTGDFVLTFKKCALKPGTQMEDEGRITLQFTTGDSETISCTFPKSHEDKNISCRFVPPCELEIRGEVGKRCTTNRKNIKTSEPIEFKQNDAKKDLPHECSFEDKINVGDSKVCDNGKSALFFKISSTTPHNLTNRDISCKLKSEEKSQISCELLPPRCTIHGMRDNQTSPLRCKRTEAENITISGGNLTAPGITCTSQEPDQDNQVREKICLINVTKIHEDGQGSGPLYCNATQGTEQFGSAVCRPLPKILALNCSLSELKFDNRSQCKHENGELSIPKSIYREYQRNVSKITNHCTHSENTHKQAENRCLMTIKSEKEGAANFYHCDTEKIAELQRELVRICSPATMPTHLHNYQHSGRDEAVKIKIETEEATETYNEKERKTLELVKALYPESDPWQDIDEVFDFAPTSLFSAGGFVAFVLFL